MKISNRQSSKASLVLLSLALLSLAGCIQSSGQYGLYTDTSIVSIDKTTAQVGEYVTVTIQGTLALREGSELPDADFKDVLLGACFRSQNDSSTGGYCGVGDTAEPLPRWITVSPQPDSHVESFGTVNVTRGESRVVTVTFSFTTVQPMILEVAPWFYSDSRLRNYGIGHQGAFVIFK